jgi:hypothetical protein
MDLIAVTTRVVGAREGASGVPLPPHLGASRPLPSTTSRGARRSDTRRRWPRHDEDAKPAQRRQAGEHRLGGVAGPDTLQEAACLDQNRDIFRIGRAGPATAGEKLEEMAP